MKHIEQVMPTAIAISCHFVFSVSDMGWHLLTILMNDPDRSGRVKGVAGNGCRNLSGHLPLCANHRPHELKIKISELSALADVNNTKPWCSANAIRAIASRIPCEGERDARMTRNVGLGGW
jgi:hypothetical protein